MIPLNEFILLLDLIARKKNTTHNIINIIQLIFNDY